MNLTALRELAYRPAPEPFTGTWSAIVWQPELSGVQRFVVGVVVRGQGQQAARLMSEPGRLDCFFRPRSIAADFTWLISMARSQLAQANLDAPIALPVLNLTATAPQFVSGQSAEALAETLFAQLVPAAKDEIEAPPARPYLDTASLRELVHNELKRITGLDYSRIVREAGEIIRDRGDHAFDVDIITARAVGSVISADYKSLASIERNLLRAAHDVQAYSGSRNKDARGIFIFDPIERPGLTAKERKDVERFLDEERWKLDCAGFSVATNHTPELLALDVRDWAAPLLA